MDFRWEGTPIQLACLFAIAVSGLLLFHFINRKVKEQSRHSEERFRNLILSVGVMNDSTATPSEDSLLRLLQDVTEQKVKSVTRNSQELLSIVAAIAHMGPWRYHQDTGLFYFDDIFYAIYATNTAAEGAVMPRRNMSDDLCTQKMRHW